MSTLPSAGSTCCRAPAGASTFLCSSSIPPFSLQHSRKLVPCRPRSAEGRFAALPSHNLTTHVHVCLKHIWRSMRRICARPPPERTSRSRLNPAKSGKKVALPPSPFCQHCVFSRTMFEFRIRMCADEVRMHAVPWPRPSACPFVRTQASKGRKVPKGDLSWPRTEAGVQEANEVRCDIKILCGRGGCSNYFAIVGSATTHP